MEIYFTYHTTFTILMGKRYNSMFFVYSQICVNITTNSTIFSPIKNTPPNHQHQSPFLLISPHPSPRQPLIYFLSQVCLLWTLCMDGITLYVVFCVWLLSLSIMFSRFSHISVPYFFSWLDNVSLHVQTTFFTSPFIT